MKRRTFLKTLAGLSIAGGHQLALVGAQNNRGEKVVVIGAGMAGLAAAVKLRQQGFEVTVVEARDRVGGRINTDRSMGTAVDLGASWVHGVNGNPLTDLAQRSGSKLARSQFERLLPFDDDGTQLDLATVGRLQLRAEALIESVGERAQQRESDVSMKVILEESLKRQQWTAQQRRTFDFIVSTVELADAATIDQMSARDGDEYEEFSGGDHLVVNGYETMARHMARDLDIRTGVAVKTIDHTRSRVRIETTNGRLEADRVVVTVPLGVLQAGKIKFSPALPDDKQAAISRMGMGTFNKIALRFAKPFWPKDPHIMAYASSQRGKYPLFLNLFHYTDQPVLICLVPPSFENALEDLSHADAHAGVLEVLRTMFGSSVPQPAATLQTRWQTDPWSLGSYSFNKLGSTGDDRDRLAAPVGDRLFFAGEATDRAYYATVHAAYLSGVRAAREVAALA